MPLKIKIVLSKGILRTYANGVDPNQTPQNAESDEGHRCLLNEQEFVNVQKKSMTTLKFKVDTLKLGTLGTLENSVNRGPTPQNKCGVLSSLSMLNA